jgi:MinD superfamily P-loop ATPase
LQEIAVLSGKGGTGKTCLSAAFATLNNNVVVVDCDVDTANLFLILQPENHFEEKFVSGQKAVINRETCVDCGVCMEYCRFDAITNKKGQITISPALCDGCMLCMRVCKHQSIIMIQSDSSRWYYGTFRNGLMVHARLEPGEENSGKLVNIVRKKAREMAKETGCNTIIIDGPPGTGCPVISSLTGAQKVIVVTEPTCSGFHDMKRIIELIEYFSVKPFVVINKYDLNVDITGQIIDWCHDKKIDMVGKIAFDTEIVEAMLHCKSIVEWNPNSPTSKEIITIWNNVDKDEQTTSN